MRIPNSNPQCAFVAIDHPQAVGTWISEASLTLPWTWGNGYHAIATPVAISCQIRPHISSARINAEAEACNEFYEIFGDCYLNTTAIPFTHD